MDNRITILYISLIFLIFVVTILIAVFIIIKRKEKKSATIVDKEKDKDEIKTNIEKNTIKLVKEYEAKSIFDFMEFENVKDNMIIQKKGKRFLMAIECQGINYDLMSDVEKASTEQSFATFLNTLKEPIQIYIQTRTVNLEKNIKKYKEKLIKIREELNIKEYKFKKYLESDNTKEIEIKNKQFDVIRENNLYLYGKDIIADTERMSLNKNVLKKKYYIIIKYFYEPKDVENGEENLLSKDEIADEAFSNLYTRAVSIIRVLSGIGIIGKALNSFELVDLLYNAYNRDDSEVFGIEKAIDAGFNEIYIDAQSSLDKKIEALNKEIEIKAREKISNALEEVDRDERRKELANMEENLEDLISNLANQMLEDEKNNISEEIKKKVINKMQKKHIKKGDKEIDAKKETNESNRKYRAG